METTVEVEVEFDDADVFEAVKDAVGEYAEEAAREYCEYNLDMPDVQAEIEGLLEEFKRRLTGGDNLCGVGTLAKEVIELVAQPLVAEPYPISSPDAARRIARLEEQVKVLLDAVCSLGERAASVIPND